MGTTLIHDRKSIADQERKKQKYKHRNNKNADNHSKKIGYQHFLFFYSSSSTTSSKDTL